MADHLVTGRASERGKGFMSDEISWVEKMQLAIFEVLFPWANFFDGRTPKRVESFSWKRMLNYLHTDAGMKGIPFA